MYMCIFNLSAALLNLAAYMHIFKHINVLSRAFATKMNKKHPLTPQMAFLPGDHTSRCVLVGESGFYRKKWSLILCVFALANGLQMVFVGRNDFCFIVR